MQAEDIKKFIETKVTQSNKYVKIQFNKRPALYGMFIISDDFGYLSSKNFWRIVTRNNFEAFQNAKRNDLARIFNGAEFSRLSLLTEEF